MLIENANVLILNDINNHMVWQRTAGAYRIATEIRKNGYTCQVVDCFTDFTDSQFYELFDRCIGPDTLMVGISSTFIKVFEGNSISKFPKWLTYPFELERMKYLFDYIKQKNPKVKIVIGGYKAQYNTAPYADTLMTGLADKAIIDYLKYIQGKNPFFQFTTNEFNQMVVDGDAFHPMFDFQQSQIIYNEYDNIMPNETLAIEIARGCIFKCSFCSYNLNGKKKNDYIKTHYTIKDELLRNYYEYGITDYIYSDDTHNDNLEKLQQMAEVVQSLPFKLQYSAYLRLDLLRAHPEQYQLFKDGGMKGAFFGIETLNYEAAKVIGKGIRPEHVIEELYKFRDIMPHVALRGSFLIGLPKETKETIAEWTDKIVHPDFPLDGYLVAPLGLNNTKTKKYKSGFEEDADKHYSWDDYPSNQWKYEDKFDFAWASQFSNELNRRLKYKDKISAFETTAASHGTDTYFGKKVMMEHLDEIMALRKLFRDAYVKKLFSNNTE